MTDLAPYTLRRQAFLIGCGCILAGLLFFGPGTKGAVLMAFGGLGIWIAGRVVRFAKQADDRGVES